MGYCKSKKQVLYLGRGQADFISHLPDRLSAFNFCFLGASALCRQAQTGRVKHLRRKSPGSYLEGCGTEWHFRVTLENCCGVCCGSAKIHQNWNYLLYGCTTSRHIGGLPQIYLLIIYFIYLLILQPFQFGIYLIYVCLFF